MSETTTAGSLCVHVCIDKCVDVLCARICADICVAWVRKVLDRLDRNGDGRLSRSEVHEGMLELGLRPVANQVDALVSCLRSCL